MMGLRENWEAIIVLVVCQFMFSGVTLIGRAALLQQMSSRVFVVYRHFIAFFAIAPIAYFSRRGCCLRWKTFWLIFLLSFIGVTVNQIMYFEGLYLASSSAATALFNLVPAITFVLAYILGLEKLNLRSLTSVAKVVGTVICVGGAAAMALLKGPKLLSMEFQTGNSLLLVLVQHHDTWLLGCLLLLGSALCWSIWLIMQVHVTACYPDHLSLTAWMCLMAAIQSGIFTFIVEPDTKVWKLTSPLQVFCCLFSGVASAIIFFGQAWSVAKKGPLFSAMFGPLSIVIVTILAFIFLHEELHIGSVMGGLAVIVGLYIVLWGKAKDNEEMKDAITTQINKENNHNTLHSPVSDNIDLERPLLPETSAKLTM